MKTALRAACHVQLPISQMAGTARLLVLLIGTFVVPLTGQPPPAPTAVSPPAQTMTANFPVDRSLCPSDNIACMMGTFINAAEFPARMVTRPDPVVNEGYLGTSNPLTQTQWLLPEGFVVDYTGGLQLPPETYRAPEAYVNEDGASTYVGLNVTILVNDTHFTPQRVSVMPNTTVTWLLQTFETVLIRSDDDGGAFNSGPINRNWMPRYVHVFDQEGVHDYRNAEVEAWQGDFTGRIEVKAYNCSTYADCMTCELYSQCIWCPGSNKCMERNPATNLPLDSYVVINLPFVQGREYQGARYMEGYDLRTASNIIAWFPWPAIRRVPRKIPDSEVPTYFDPLSSTSCIAYKRNRAAENCSDFPAQPPKNRVHGIERPNRPRLSEFFMCYDHLMTSWSKPDLPVPVVNPLYPPPRPSQNVTHNVTQTGSRRLSELPFLDSPALDPSLDVSFETVARASSSSAGRPGRPRSHHDELGTDAEHGPGQQQDTPGLVDDPLDTTYRPLTQVAPPVIQMSPREAVGSADAYMLTPTRRRTQLLVLTQQITAWDRIPSAQRIFAGPSIAGVDMWARLQAALTLRFGPRCNATHNCDDLRGTCLNISGHPIIGYDQNGTCRCHPWFGGDDCSSMILNDVTCAGFPDHDYCQRIRYKLYFCGNVQSQDGLPQVCLDQGLTVVQCGQAGHMRGNRSVTGTPNFVGRPENGYASTACIKCLARVGQSETLELVRMETFSKSCDPKIMLRFCQRQEDAWAQRICNYCGDWFAREGSVLPQGGRAREKQVSKMGSYFRGTRIGSVEKRLRGIVPPNLDIVGHNMAGGLRYCKRSTTFSSSRHYYTEADLMQPGQTCRLDGPDAFRPMFENWDFSRRFPCSEFSLFESEIEEAAVQLRIDCNPNVVTDHFGTRCLNPDDPVTCPKARLCVGRSSHNTHTDDNICHTDSPDFRDLDVLVAFKGLEAMRFFADPLPTGYTCNMYVPFATYADPVARQTFLTNWAYANQRVPIPCTFFQHAIVLFPDRDVESIMRWLGGYYVDRQYIRTYMIGVDWGFESRLVPPPPPSPPLPPRPPPPPRIILPPPAKSSLPAVRIGWSSPPPP